MPTTVADYESGDLIGEACHRSVLMFMATPISNPLHDFKHLVGVFTRGDDAYAPHARRYGPERSAELDHQSKLIASVGPLLIRAEADVAAERAEAGGAARLTWSS